VLEGRREFKPGSLLPQVFIIEGIIEFLLVLLQELADFVDVELQLLPKVIVAGTERPNDVRLGQHSFLLLHHQQLGYPLHCDYVVLLLCIQRLHCLKSLLNFDLGVDVLECDLVGQEAIVILEGNLYLLDGIHELFSVSRKDLFIGGILPRIASHAHSAVQEQHRY
jgi:hypothetical protein